MDKSFAACVGRAWLSSTTMAATKSASMANNDSTGAPTLTKRKIKDAITQLDEALSSSIPLKKQRKNKSVPAHELTGWTVLIVQRSAGLRRRRQRSKLSCRRSALLPLSRSRPRTTPPPSPPSSRASPPSNSRPSPRVPRLSASPSSAGPTRRATPSAVRRARHPSPLQSGARSCMI